MIGLNDFTIICLKFGVIGHYWQSVHDGLRNDHPVERVFMMERHFSQQHCVITGKTEYFDSHFLCHFKRIKLNVIFLDGVFNHQLDDAHGALKTSLAGVSSS
jgi:hypothetical protein